MALRDNDKIKKEEIKQIKVKDNTKHIYQNRIKQTEGEKPKERHKKQTQKQKPPHSHFQDSHKSTKPED